MGRAIAVFGALAGAAGVLLLALGAHLDGGARLTVAGQMLLAHAPLLHLLGLGTAGGPMRKAGARLIALGLLLFSGSLSLRVFTGTPFLPVLAPLGGAALILGWVCLAFGALRGWR